MFRSVKQEKFLFAKHPEIAKKWAMEHPKNASNMMKGPRLNVPKAPKPPKFSGWSK